MPEFTHQKVKDVSEFLQNYMRDNELAQLTADECADILATNNVLPNDVGPKPGFDFRQMLRDGRDKKIPLVTGAYQDRANTKWLIIFKTKG